MHVEHTQTWSAVGQTHVAAFTLLLDQRSRPFGWSLPARVERARLCTRYALSCVALVNVKSRTPLLHADLHGRPFANAEREVAADAGRAQNLRGHFRGESQSAWCDFAAAWSEGAVQAMHKKEPLPNSQARHLSTRSSSFWHLGRTTRTRPAWRWWPRLQGMRHTLSGT